MRKANHDEIQALAVEQGMRSLRDGGIQLVADGVTTISDLQGKSQDLTLYGSPECRQRVDCLVGLEKYYGLKFKKFTPVDIGLRYEVLDKGQADLSIIFTTDRDFLTYRRNRRQAIPLICPF